MLNLSQPKLSKVALFSKEYPPYVYGGAGVHVEYLSRALAKLIQVEVRSFGDQLLKEGSLVVRGYKQWDETKVGSDPRFTGAIDAFARSLVMAKDHLDAQLVHCHTWYTDMGGVIASQLWGIPYVLTIHSLEPLRPWKYEQLGNAYHLSAWMERTAIEQADAIIAVSRETKADVLRLYDVKPERVHVIHNGIDPVEYCPTPGTDVLAKYGIDPARPFLLFVGRITRQKGIIHLVNAIPHIDPALQIVLCAGAPDTPEIGREMEEGVAKVAAQRPGVIWIREMISRPEVIQLYTNAAMFCCPSVYEPFGIINLEAMACETAVVASAVGGIPEVVVPDETGLLVNPGLIPGTFDPADPAAFSKGLADAVNKLAHDPALRARFGKAGRDRVIAHFSWDAIAQATVALYSSLVEQRSGIR
jgi:glycogen synthase